MIEKNCVRDAMGARICSEISSPLGALSNFIELLETSDVRGRLELKELSLGFDSLKAKLLYMRIAYGFAEKDLAYSVAQIEGIVRGALEGRRLAITLDGEGIADRPEARLVCLAIQCFKFSIPFGGSIKGFRKTDGRWTFLVIGDNDRLIGTRWLSGRNTISPSVTSPDEVEFEIFSELIDASGRNLEVELSDGRMRASF